MNQLPFIKMHGLGNDFVVLDARSNAIELSTDLVRWIGDRNRGVGFDQLVLVEPDEVCDARVTFYNADGSKAGACGNATRCLGAWLGNEEGKLEITMQSVAGPLRTRTLSDGRIEAQMSEPSLAWQDIPLAEACDTLNVPIEVDDLPRPVAVSMGNPHAVFFVDDVNRIEQLGPKLETHSFFPDRANIGFAQVKNLHAMRLRVFERGAGLTQACGSGACAAHVAAFRKGLVGELSQIEVDGGTLEIAWGGAGPVFMIGPAAISFRGVIEVEAVPA